MRKPKVKKPYKSLDEIYLRESFARPVPGLPYKDIINEAKVKITFSDGRVREVETSDYTAGKLLGAETKITSNLNEEIKKWFSAGGWSSVAISIGLPLLITIVERNLKTNNTGVVKEIIEDINNIVKIKKTLHNFRDNLASKTFDSFIANFPIKLKQLNNKSLIKDIERNLVFAEGNVSLGPGEVLATLYSEMVNPKTGDLLFQDGKKVEMKGSTKENTGGRPGKKNVVNAANRATDILRAEYGKRKGEMDQALISDLVNLFAPFKTKFNFDLAKLRGNQKRFMEIANIFLSNKISINIINDTINQISKNLKALAAAGDKLTGTKIGTQFVDKINEYKKSREGKEVKTFRNYFNTEKDPNILTDKIIMFSVYPQSIDKTFLLDYIAKIGNAFNSEYAAKIVSGIQIADYQFEEKFSYILFFNSLTNNQVVIGEFTTDYNTNLKMCIQKTAEFKDVDPGTGGTVARGGFNVIV